MLSVAGAVHVTTRPLQVPCASDGAPGVFGMDGPGELIGVMACMVAVGRLVSGVGGKQTFPCNPVSAGRMW